MSRKALHWYCPDVVRSATGMTTKASLLSSMLINDLDDPDLEALDFSAFLVGSTGVEPIRCRVAVITEFASGTDENGMPVTLFNGERSSGDLGKAAISTAQNQVVLHIEGGTPTNDRPALISTEEGVSFSCRPIAADLYCSTVAEVPDFVVGLERSREFEDQLRGDWYERPPVTYSDEVAAHAKQMRLGPGHILPVSFHDGVRDQVGALVLGQEASGPPLRFFGKLYTFHELDRLGPGAILSRNLQLKTGAHGDWRSSEVARIVSVLESC